MCIKCQIVTYLAILPATWYHMEGTNGPNRNHRWSGECVKNAEINE